MTVTVAPVASELRYIAGYEVRAVATDGKHLECLVTDYGVERDVGPFLETMDAGVFSATLKDHWSDVPLLVGHDDTRPAVGVPVQWLDTEKDLHAVYRFLTHFDAQRAQEMAEQRAWSGVSVGFLPGRKAQHNTWSRDADGHLHVRRHQARLLHLGMVTVPANEDARMQVRSLGVPEDLDRVLETPNLDTYRKVLESIRAGRIEVP